MAPPPLPSPRKGLSIAASTFRRNGKTIDIHIWNNGDCWFMTFLTSQGAVPPKLKLRRDRYATENEVRDRAIEVFVRKQGDSWGRCSEV